MYFAPDAVDYALVASPPGFGIRPIAIRPYTSDLARGRGSLPLRVVTYYANVRPAEPRWQHQTLGPFRKLILGDGTMPAGLPVFGVESASHLEQLLGEFREVLLAICHTSAKQSHRFQDLLDEVHSRAALEVRSQAYDSESRRLKPRYGTRSDSFREMLYSYLILSFYDVPVHYLRHCIACGRFFFTSSGQPAKYCTGRCQIRTAMRRYRKKRTLGSRQGAKP